VSSAQLAIVIARVRHPTPRPIAKSPVSAKSAACHAQWPESEWREMDGALWRRGRSSDASDARGKTPLSVYNTRIDRARHVRSTKRSVAAAMRQAASERRSSAVALETAAPIPLRRGRPHQGRHRFAARSGTGREDQTA